MSKKEKKIASDKKKETAPAQDTAVTEENIDSQNELKALQDELASVQNDLNEKNELLLRTVAEYDNFRKRSVKEKENIYSSAVTDIISSILPVVDNLERAIETQDTSSFEDFKKGVRMTYDQLLAFLSDNNVEVIDTNIPFNPDIHNAVMHEEDDSKESNLITDCFQKGYKLGDKVIRYSIVKVVN